MAFRKTIKRADAIEAEWTWDSDNDCWVEEPRDHHEVRAVCYPLPEDEKTLVLVYIDAGKHHGRTTAMSDYRYIIGKGSCDVVIWDDSGVAETRHFEKGDYFDIEAGTTYDYIASDEGDFEATLFMNNLWDPRKE